MVDKLRHGAYVDPRAGMLPASEMFETFLAQGSHRSSTVRAYRSLWASRVEPILGDVPVVAITAADVHAVLDAARADGLAPASVAATRRLVSAVLNAAVRADRIASNPATRVPAPRIPRSARRFLTADELAALADVIEPRFRALVLVGGLGGLRIAELAGLDVAHVETMRRRIRVEQQANDTGTIVPPKSDASRRTVAIGTALAAEVAVHVERFAPEGGPLFTMPRGGRLVPSSFRRRWWADAVDAAGLAPLTPHALRHTAAALAIEAGAHPKALQTRLGHSAISTTLDVYGGLLDGLDERVADDVERALARRIEDAAASGADE
jgi:integrase